MQTQHSIAKFEELLSEHSAQRGQLSGFVKSLQVHVTVATRPADSKMIHGEIEYSYSHPGGGRNGMTVRFIIALEHDFDAWKYSGAVESNLFSQAREHQST